MQQNLEYYVIGGEYTSLNFHSFRVGTAIVLGPYQDRKDAEEEWKKKSEGYRHMAGYRFVIVEAPKVTP